MKGKKKSLYWVAFVMCQCDKKLVGSFLSFWADNRFYARKAIEGMLPDNLMYLDSSGKLRDFKILTLHQCKEEEAGKYSEIYTERFSDIVNGEIENRETTIYT